MRTLLISLAAAASALAIATPASAQWYPQPTYQVPYGHQVPYGYQNPYGHQRGYGVARALQVRVDRIQRDLGHLARQRMISRNEYQNRQQDARQIERRLRHQARDGYGLSRQELYDIERRIQRLEYRIARDIRDGRRYAYRWF